MIVVLTSASSRYPVSRVNIKRVVEDYLKKQNLDDVEVSVAIVGSRKMRELNKKWRNLDESTTVLTFGLEEPRGLDGILRLGDIVISYPEARLIAQGDDLTMDQAIEKLLIHGLNNLLYKKETN